MIVVRRHCHLMRTPVIDLLCEYYCFLLVEIQLNYFLRFTERDVLKSENCEDYARNNNNSTSRS
jgi:hypothetical protein